MLTIFIEATLLSCALTILVALSVAIYRDVFGYFNFVIASLFVAFSYVGIAIANEEPIAAIVLGVVAVFSFIGSHSLMWRASQRHQLSTDACLIMSLGLYVAMEQVVSLFYGDEIRLAQFDRNELIVTIDIDVLTNFFLATIIVLVGSQFFSRTEDGARFKAVVENRTLAKSQMSSISRVDTVSLLLVITLIATAGLFSSIQFGAFPSAGFNPMVLAFAAVLLGGRSYSSFLVLVVALLAILNQVSVFAFGSDWRIFISQVVIIAAILLSTWRPRGA